MKNYLPECRTKITQLSSLEELESLVGKEIHVRPFSWIKSSNSLVVYVSNQWEFIVKGEDLSIYENSYFEDCYFPKEVNRMIGQKVISVKVCRDENGNIFLSRKENMEDAINDFSIGAIVYGKLVNIHQNICFFDIGAGVVGVCTPKELSTSWVKSSKEFLNKLNMKEVPLKIIGTKPDEPSKFVLSYKKTLDAPEFNEGDIVEGKISFFLPNGDTSGVFVELHPLVSAILDVDDLDVFYSVQDAIFSRRGGIKYIILGQKYRFRIVRKNEKGYKVKIVSFNSFR